MLFVLDFFDRDLFVLINQRWASPALDPMMIFLSSKWAFVPLLLLEAHPASLDYLENDL